MEKQQRVPSGFFFGFSLVKPKNPSSTGRKWKDIAHTGRLDRPIYVNVLLYVHQEMPWQLALSRTLMQRADRRA